MPVPRLLVVALVALGGLEGCTALLGLNAPERAAQPDSGGGDDAPVTIDAPMIDAPPGGYHAAAVRFDPAGGDYMSQNGLLGAPSASQVGTFSVWLHFNGGDGSAQTIAAASVVLNGGVTRNANNKIQFVLFQCNGSPVLDMQTAHAYTSASGWIHVLAAWDLQHNKAQIYVNGVLDTANNPGISAGNICYNAPGWYIGGTNGGSLNADVADLFATFDTFLDLGAPVNRAAFRDVSGRPVDLGQDCASVTGTSPIACFIGPVAGWSTNKGTGSGFTLHGDGLATAPTSPSG